MTVNKTAKYCNFCSEFVQANGEDPLGSAGNHECWLIIEAAPPWKINICLEPNPMP